MSANRYYSLNDYCKEVFGEKVYRLSLSGGMTCPNRDGTLSYGGCAFCSAGGSGDFAADAFLPVSEQFIQARQKIAAKTHCQKFIAYFQSFTNTYAPVDVLRQLYSEAMAPEEIVALSIGTRSDCLPPETLELALRGEQDVQRRGLAAGFAGLQKRADARGDCEGIHGLRREERQRVCAGGNARGVYGLRRMAGRAESVSGRQPRLCDGLREGAFPEGDRHAAGGDLPDVAGLPRAGA